MRGNPSSGSSGHVFNDGDTSPGQTRKKPKDISTPEGEECGSVGGWGCVFCVRNLNKFVYDESIKRDPLLLVYGTKFIMNR